MWHKHTTSLTRVISRKEFLYFFYTIAGWIDAHDILVSTCQPLVAEAHMYLAIFEGLVLINFMGTFNHNKYNILKSSYKSAK